MNDINIKKWVVPNKWVARWIDNKLDVQDLGGDWCLYVRSYGETIIGGRSDVFILPKNGIEGFSVDGRIADEKHGVATDYQIIFLSSGNIVKEAKVLSKHLNISAIQAYKILKKQLKKGFGEYRHLLSPRILKSELEALGARVILKRRGDRGGYFELKEQEQISFRERYLLGRLKVWNVLSKIQLKLI